MRFNRSENLDTDLNIVPIIDCFVMLICFLLFTAAFTQLVFLEAKLTSNTAAAAEKSRSELDQFRLVVTFEDELLRLKATGSQAAGKWNLTIPKQGGQHDFNALHAHLIAVKTEHPQRLSADIEFKTKQASSVQYEEVLKAIDSLRHLTEEEYGALRVAQKKARKLELSASEEEKAVSPAIDNLAQRLMQNEIARETDPKLLFPDIALVGMD